MSNLIDDLTTRWGFGTSEIARALNTSPAVIRRWQRGGEPNADEVTPADKLDEFCDDLAEAGVEPGAILAAPLVEGYTAIGWDLYLARRPQLVLAVVRGELTAEEALAEHDPDWRRTYWTSFKTVESGDGCPSIVGKDYDDVIAQVGR